MSSFNKIIIVGYLGADPELRHTSGGTAVCNFRLATTQRAGRDQEEKTTWFRVSVYGNQANACAEYLKKGRQVYVEGRLSAEEYTDREGKPRFSLNVNASDVQFLGGRGEETPARREASASGGRQSFKQDAPTTERIGDDDIPF